MDLVHAALQAHERQNIALRQKVLQVPHIVTQDYHCFNDPRYMSWKVQEELVKNGHNKLNWFFTRTHQK
jgi:hypothetical protein